MLITVVDYVNLHALKIKIPTMVASEDISYDLEVTANECLKSPGKGGIVTHFERCRREFYKGLSKLFAQCIQKSISKPYITRVGILISV